MDKNKLEKENQIALFIDEIYSDRECLRHCCGVNEIGGFNFNLTGDISTCVEDWNDSYNVKKYGTVKYGEIKEIVVKSIGEYFNKTKYPTILTLNNKQQSLMLSMLRQVSRSFDRGVFTFKKCISGSTKNELTLVIFIPKMPKKK